MQKKPFISIVIPAYKEESRIHKVLNAIVEYKSRHNFSIEVIVVLDGTPDNTLESAKKYNEKIAGLKIIDRKKNMGKGYTVKEGVLAAKGKYILFTDADNATPIDQVDKLLRFKDDFDTIIGSRYCKGGKLAHPQSLTRRIGSRILNIFIKMLAVHGIADTQCGFKLFEHNAAKEIFKRMTFDRFSFDIEILAISRLLNHKIKEVGVTWYDDPHSTVSPIKDGLKMIHDAWRINRNRAKGNYNKENSCP